MLNCSYGKIIIIIIINVLQYRHTNINKNKHVCSNSDGYLKAGGKHCQQLEVSNYNLVKISYIATYLH